MHIQSSVDLFIKSAHLVYIKSKIQHIAWMKHTFSLVLCVSMGSKTLKPVNFKHSCEDHLSLGLWQNYFIFNEANMKNTSNTSHELLKIILPNRKKQNIFSDIKNTTSVYRHIDCDITDSVYHWSILMNTTQLTYWGLFEAIPEFLREAGFFYLIWMSDIDDNSSIIIPHLKSTESYYTQLIQ